MSYNLNLCYYFY